MSDIPVNHRGFKIYGEVTDSRECSIRVQESSAIGRPYAYLFIASQEGHLSPHLSVELVRELRDVLTLFIEDAESPDNWRNTPEYQREFG